MAKLYSEYLPSEMEDLKPKKETIEYLLNYSKALSVVNYKKMKFESLLN